MCRSTPRIWTREPWAAEAEHVNLTTMPPGLPWMYFLKVFSPQIPIALWCCLGIATFLISHFSLFRVCLSVSLFPHLFFTSVFLPLLRSLFFLCFQAWSQWQQQLLCVRRERRKVVSAVKHHQHWQKWRSLKAWLEYLQGRRMKRQWKGERGVPGSRDRGSGHNFTLLLPVKLIY